MNEYAKPLGQTSVNQAEPTLESVINSIRESQSRIGSAAGSTTEQLYRLGFATPPSVTALAGALPAPPLLGPAGRPRQWSGYLNSTPCSNRPPTTASGTTGTCKSSSNPCAGVLNRTPALIKKI